MRKIVLLVILILLAMPLGTAGASTTTEFGDVNDHWAQSDIIMVAGLHLMNGTAVDAHGVTLFSPQNLVSRAQLAVVLQNTFHLDYGSKVFGKHPQATDYYEDVADTEWYSEALVMCAVNEIFPIGGKFGPDREVSRIEVAQTIYRCFNARGISIPMIMMMPVFEDTSTLTQTETNAMVFVNNTGIMKGYDNRFRPYESLSRAELAVVIARCVDLIALNENYQGNTYQLNPDQNFFVGLTSNPSTGYEWQVRNPGNPDIIRMSGQAFYGPKVTGKPVVGQSGRQFFQFHGMDSGNTQIELVYSRPWESVQPAKIFSLKVLVK